MNTSSPDVSLVIISLNSRRYVAGLLDSVKSAEWREVTYETVIVDNGSTDDTLDLLASRYPETTVIANGANLGYCRAGNIGAAASRGRYVLFLNDDIVILSDAICKLVEWMDEHPKAGMIGCHLLNPDGTDQFQGRTFATPAVWLYGRKSPLRRLVKRLRPARPSEMDRVSDTEPYEVDWVSAAAMMAHREALSEVHGLEESFYYFHEHVVCKRLQAAGYKNYVHPLSKVIHFSGAGSGVRTRPVRCLHIKAFHKAAYDWICFHHHVSRYNPIRLLLGAGLGIRAGALILVENLKPDPDRVSREIAEGRPEGGNPR